MGKVNRNNAKKASLPKNLLEKKTKPMIMKKTARPKPPLKTMKKQNPPTAMQEKSNKNMKSTPPKKVIKQKNNKPKQNKKTVAHQTAVEVKLNDALIQSGISALRCVLDPTKPLDQIQLQVSVKEIAKETTGAVVYPLQHTLVEKDSKICLILDKEDPENIADLLKGKVIIDRIITCEQFFKEGTEAKKKWAILQSYDYFLVDKNVRRKVKGKFVKVNKRRCKPVFAVDFQADLSENIQKALRLTEIPLHVKGNTFVVQIARANMTDEQIMDNVKAVFEGLCAHLPGGIATVKSLFVKTASSKAFLVYVGTGSNLEVNILKRKAEGKAETPMKKKLAKLENGKTSKVADMEENDSNSGDEEDDVGSASEELDSPNLESGDDDDDDDNDVGSGSENLDSPNVESEDEDDDLESGSEKLDSPNVESGDDDDEDDLSGASEDEGMELPSRDEGVKENEWNSGSEESDEMNDLNSESEDDED